MHIGQSSVGAHSTEPWYKARKREGIENFRWHDLRHTWASWHVQGGTPLYALQEMGGRSGPEMVQKCAHLTADHLALYADRLCVDGALGVPADGTFTAQPEKEKGPRFP